MLSSDFGYSSSNNDWLAALASNDGNKKVAVKKLGDYLSSVLRKRADREDRLGLSKEEVEDIVQDSLIAILSSLGSFRGDSRFLSWCVTISTRKYFRARRKWLLMQFENDFDLDKVISQSVDPLYCADLSIQVEEVEQFIATSLSERQQVALWCLVNGVPLEVLALKYGISRGSVYKVLHDARKKLRKCLIGAGVNLDDMF